MHFTKEVSKEPIVEQEPIVVAKPNVETIVQPIHKSCNVQLPSRVPLKKWLVDDMKREIVSVEDNNMSVRATSINYGIPNTTLRSWMMEIINTERRGPRTILSIEEEVEVIQWCKDMAEIDHGLQVDQLQSTVVQIIGNRANSFTNGMIGRSWWVGFR